ncbi:MAG: prepilin-type N-terminal cleavage/methylation domain-containing protein [Opitutae bacterium]|nr:prepilin-type N-terminal cleavage/methylation domain-containing protein [Opitutae bacterium]
MGLAAPPRRDSRAGLSLVEVLVATTLLGILMTAVMSSFVFMLRGQTSLTNYASMNSDSRALLELLSRDAKSATAVTNFTTTSLTLSVPQNTSGTTQDVTYEYDAAAKSLVRETGGTSTTLVSSVDSFSFRYFNSNNATTTSLAELKQVQLSLRIVRSIAFAYSSQYVISAQYTLRAKPTAH